jgi:hypothetical protein
VEILRVYGLVSSAFVSVSDLLSEPLRLLLDVGLVSDLLDLVFLLEDLLVTGLAIASPSVSVVFLAMFYKTVADVLVINSVILMSS